MINTNGLSPLMQAAVGGEEEFHTSGMPDVLYNTEGETIDTTTGSVDEGNFSEKRTDESGRVYYEVLAEVDPKGDYVRDIVVEGVYKTGDRLYVESPIVESEQGNITPEGGVGGVLAMQSPIKNYKNPQDYKVFNFGNKPTPFEKRKKEGY